ncbi:putative E3 ubiquitin-protein ligase LIN-1 isoform X2 [Andrographis paniculata]|uniref:putative E3 ubiquitin-protein ligase LIN-1 isoform X2 n=1 Tax=Andrographis paniculata TaxID=175694 RepID=UPI0021E87932|nr:putative E3 ubiquitin-protein ligase LIN-1 isoform X2 [Andrographis paniculata]
MASLHKLLSDDGFESTTQPQPLPAQNKKKNNNNKENKDLHHINFNFKDRGSARELDTVALPIYICHDRRSFDSSWKTAEKKALSIKSSSLFWSRRRQGTSSDKSKSNSKLSAAVGNPRRDEPAIDDAAIKAVISILSGYIGQYSRDKGFRRSIRDKCRACIDKTSRRKHSESGEIFTHLEVGIQGVDRMVENRGAAKSEMDLESLQQSIKILKIVVDSAGVSSDSTVCRKPDSFLAACAHLYLSIVYKIARNDKISAGHLLQVFNEAPNLARKHLLPELWEHFFLPHLLHLKIWCNKEHVFLANSGYEDKARRIKALKAQYSDSMDIGTAQFASYYMEWLKVGAQAPSVPTVPVPSKPRSRRHSADYSAPYRDSSNKSLYQAVFGPSLRGRSMELGNGNGSPEFTWDAEVEERARHGSAEDDVIKKSVAQRRRMSSSQSDGILQKAELWPPDGRKSDYFRFLGCRTEPVECLVQETYLSNEDKIQHDESDRHYQLGNASSAIATICSSESLSECELAIRALSEAWLESHGDCRIESALSQAKVIQGIMEVLYVSHDDEILELAVSILAELANKSKKNKKCILNSDPKLDVLLRLLKSSSLFLKAAILLYLVKPRGKQMVSMDWIPLVLRVLEFGDQLQTLFSVRCSPHDAAYYFLHQLLTGFDEDRNTANARQIISLGGLSLLVRRMDYGDASEKGKAASVLNYCIRADGSCRHYLVKNLKKDAILSLLVLGKQSNSHGDALLLLTELLCLNKRNQRMEFLAGLRKGWDCLNTMHIFLLLLQKASPEDRPIVAVILLLLELVGDPPKHSSVFIEEAMDAIVKALACCVLDEKVQEQSARALLILGGQFSYTGEPEVEKWLLRKAHSDEYLETWSGKKDTCNSSSQDLSLPQNEEDKWQLKAARLLLNHGNKRLLTALSDSIENSIPRLAQASLVTISWMSCGLNSLGNKEIHDAAWSILAPKLIASLDEKATLEEKSLATFALHNLTKGTDRNWGLS